MSAPKFFRAPFFPHHLPYTDSRGREETFPKIVIESGSRRVLSRAGRRENNMSAFDKIIGYEEIKKELMQISDTLKNREAYDRLGVEAPRGLLLYGEPGVGKSLMAGAVIEESGRKTFLCRKDKPNGDFVNEIKATFERAAANAPSIVYLDDMDKFSNGDERRPDAEEYVTVQSCIDEAKEKQIFVLATANNIRCLPRSLYRMGRFDRTIEIKTPHGSDAVKIISHYIGTKKFVSGIDCVTIARILDGRSCATLESVINQAGVYAGYERAETITMDHFMKACFRNIFDAAPPADPGYDDDDDDENAGETNPSLTDAGSQLAMIAYHEAGHAVISEVLCPGSVTLVSLTRGRDARDRGGFTSFYNDNSKTALYWEKSRIVGALGGAAAVEQKFGIWDLGCQKDLDQAFDKTFDFVGDSCYCGFSLHGASFRKYSEHLLAGQEQAAAAEVEKYYRKAKEILGQNSGFLEKVADALTKKQLLSAVDIRKIREDCAVVPVTL